MIEPRTVAAILLLLLCAAIALAVLGMLPRLWRRLLWLRRTEGKLTHPTEPEQGPLRIEWAPPWWYVIDDEAGEAWGPYPNSGPAREKLSRLRALARTAHRPTDGGDEP